MVELIHYTNFAMQEKVVYIEKHGKTHTVLEKGSF